MNLDALLSEIALGEDSTRQFKADLRDGDSLASEMAAFANCEGGTIFIGVADDGTLPGLSREDVSRINQLISNTANHAVRSPLAVQTENVALAEGRLVIVLKNSSMPMNCPPRRGSMPSTGSGSAISCVRCTGAICLRTRGIVSACSGT